MSWDSHIQSMLATQGNIGECAITGVDGNPWAKSPNCPLTVPEAQALISLVQAGQPDPNMKYTFGGVKLMFLMKDDGDVTVCRLATMSSPERPISDEEKALVAVSVSKTAAVFSFMTGSGQKKAADSCDREIRYLLDNGM